MTLTDTVRSNYAAVARSSLTSADAGVRAIAEAFGYSADDLASIPAEANMGLSCGNPVATAHLRAGETVVDLGSGGGLDVFLASKKVGPTGRAIGIDMTPAMIERARAAAGRDGYTNVEFHLAPVDALPLPDASVDVVISNCVINLAPDKAAVFREIARVLKPGGRLAVSDIALKQPLPPELAASVAAWTGCIAGALLTADYDAGLRAAGLSHVQILDSGADLNSYAKLETQSGAQSACCSPTMAAPSPAPTAKRTSLSVSQPAPAACCTPAAETSSSPIHTDLAALLKKFDINLYAASVKVYAVR